jgi:hypothetical protein
MSRRVFNRSFICLVLRQDAQELRSESELLADFTGRSPPKTSRPAPARLGSDRERHAHLAVMMHPAPPRKADPERALVDRVPIVDRGLTFVEAMIAQLRISPPTLGEPTWTVAGLREDLGVAPMIYVAVVAASKALRTTSV